MAMFYVTRNEKQEMAMEQDMGDESFKIRNRPPPHSMNIMHIIDSLVNPKPFKTQK
jgi:hypothetical protein